MMRLLSRQDGDLHLTSNKDPPGPYAILSHTWGKDEDEVVFEDILNHTYDKPGYEKIDFCLEQAQKDGLQYVWVDTCCIDKRDRNELGEAINRMFGWYANAAACYVFLADVVDQNISKSRWFTRGWTLQELMAPQQVQFYSSDRKFLGDKRTLRQDILAACQIDTSTHFEDVSLSKRFGWSLNRQTSKPEDASYCLLGILEVNLVFNYGEGAESARRRLFDQVESEHGRRNCEKLRSLYMLQSSSGEPSSSQALKKAMLLLKSKRENPQRVNIKDPFPSTCTWILSHESFQRWSTMQSSERFLWIKGKPGAGKSTLVKFAELESERNAGGVRLSFYYNARGDVSERTPFGMYQCLLAQLLYIAPQIEHPLVQYVNEQALEHQPWTLQSLQTALKFAIKMTISPVQCFIDALDECETSEVQAMIDYFGDLSRTAPRLFVCFASRYYPTVSIRHSVELLMENEQKHTQDLQEYVNGRLDVPDDSFGDALKQQIVTKANGIFFWAVLVIGLLNQEIRAGNLYNVQQRLHEMPNKLSDLLNQIVHRDTVELEKFRLCLQWILFAQRPLTVEEYYYAMVTSLSDAGLASAAAFTQRWTRNSTTRDMMARFVSSSSRGLAEISNENGWRTRGRIATVQFIHESVRDFLLHHEGLSTLYKNIDGDLISWIHESLARTCQTYLKIEFMVKLDTERHWRPWRPIARSKFKAAQLNAAYPFLTYASDQAIFHANKAAVSRAQDKFLQCYDTSFYGDMDYCLCFRISRPRWWHVHSNIWSQPHNLIHILAAYNADMLIPTACKLGFSLDPLENYVSPLTMAVLCGARDAAQALIACGAALNLTDINGDTPLSMAIKKRDTAMILLLLKSGAKDEGQSASSFLLS